MKATLNFTKRIDAENFAIAWARFSKSGHTIGSGSKNVNVDIYDINKDKKIWIDNYVSNMNQQNP